MVDSVNIKSAISKLPSNIRKYVQRLAEKPVEWSSLSDLDINSLIRRSNTNNISEQKSFEDGIPLFLVARMPDIFDELWLPVSFGGSEFEGKKLEDGSLLLHPHIQVCGRLFDTFEITLNYSDKKAMSKSIRPATAADILFVHWLQCESGLTRGDKNFCFPLKSMFGCTYKQALMSVKERNSELTRLGNDIAKHKKDIEQLQRDISNISAEQPSALLNKLTARKTELESELPKLLQKKSMQPEMQSMNLKQLGDRPVKYLWERFKNPHMQVNASDIKAVAEAMTIPQCKCFVQLLVFFWNKQLQELSEEDKNKHYPGDNYSITDAELKKTTKKDEWERQVANAANNVNNYTLLTYVTDQGVVTVTTASPDELANKGHLECACCGDYFCKTTVNHTDCYYSKDAGPGDAFDVLALFDPQHPYQKENVPDELADRVIRALYYPNDDVLGKDGKAIKFAANHRKFGGPEGPNEVKKAIAKITEQERLKYALETGLLSKEILCAWCVQKNTPDTLFPKFAPYPEGTTPEQVDKWYKQHNSYATAHDLEDLDMMHNELMKEDTLERETECVRKQKQDALRIICGKSKGDTEITTQDAEAYLLRCRAYLNRLGSCYCANRECPFPDFYVLKEAKNPLDQFLIVPCSDEFVNCPEKPNTEDHDDLTECFNPNDSETKMDTEEEESGEEEDDEEEDDEEEDGEEGYMEEDIDNKEICVQRYDIHSTNPSVRLSPLLTAEHYGRFQKHKLFEKANRDAAKEDPNYLSHVIDSSELQGLTKEVFVCCQACGRAMKQRLQRELATHDSHFKALHQLEPKVQADIKSRECAIKEAEKFLKQQQKMYEEAPNEILKSGLAPCILIAENHVKDLKAALAKEHPAYANLKENYAKSSSPVELNPLNIAFDSGNEPKVEAIEHQVLEQTADPPQTTVQRGNETESRQANKKQCIEVINNFIVVDE